MVDKVSKILGLDLQPKTSFVKTSVMSVLINQACFSSLLTILNVSSTDTYCKENSSLSIRSWRFMFSKFSRGADRSAIILFFLLYLLSAIPMNRFYNFEIEKHQKGKSENLSSIPFALGKW